MDVYQRRRLVALSAIAVIFVIVVLLIRSCGGDDDETPVTPVAGATGTAGATALSASEYADQGDTICLEANTALAEVDPSDSEASATEAGILGSELGSLQTLVLAEGEDGADQLDKFLSALQDQVAALEQRATASERGDDTAVAELDATVDEAASAAAKAAGKFGFTVCGDTSEVSSGGDGSTGADTGNDTGAVAPTTPPVTEVPVEPVTPAPTEPTTPPADTGGGDSGSGGVSP